MPSNNNPQHGGLRTPAGGRPVKPDAEKAIKVNLTIYAEDRDYLDSINSNRSEALRIVIERDRKR